MMHGIKKNVKHKIGNISNINDLFIIQLGSVDSNYSLLFELKTIPLGFTPQSVTISYLEVPLLLTIFHSS